MNYDFTKKKPVTFIEEEGLLVDSRVADALSKGRTVIYTTDENGHAIPIFNQE